MSIQLPLETAIGKLIAEFEQTPYTFFTEADAVVRFHELLSKDPAFSNRVRTQDNHEISLIHREYPTFFRFSDENPTERLGPESRARRGHYDTVILNPDFITAHPAETVLNRSIRAVRDQSIIPFQAVVE